jgi:hypothetical protein
MKAAILRLEFRHAGQPGSVEVEVGSNHEPDSLGTPDYAYGFPYCRATIDHPAPGYTGALGWVQLVADSQRGGDFRLDPYEPLGAVSHPFCFFGFAPTLFDAPSRSRRDDMDWLAHSFLCDLPAPNQVGAILGFSWGFSIRSEEIEIEPAAILGPEDWQRHLPELRSTSPSWSFGELNSENWAE